MKLKNKIIKITNKNNDVLAHLKVRIADTKEKMVKGLMNDTSLGKNEGMLFSYPDEQILSFWMKSTPLPLSIAFINKNKEIIQIEDLEPYDEQSVKSKNKAKWALEAHRGWFKKNNVKFGDKISIIEQRTLKIKVIK